MPTKPQGYSFQTAMQFVCHHAQNHVQNLPIHGPAQTRTFDQHRMASNNEETKCDGDLTPSALPMLLAMNAVAW